MRVRDVDSTLIAEDKYLMNQGIAYGSFTLPDSLLTGNYRFIVYTDKLVNGTPDLLFVQQITIRSSYEPAFGANLNRSEEHKVMASVKLLMD